MGRLDCTYHNKKSLYPCFWFHAVQSTVTAMTRWKHRTAGRFAGYAILLVGDIRGFLGWLVEITPGGTAIRLKGHFIISD